MLIRREAAALAAMCPKVEQTRYGTTTCINLTLQADGIIRMEATDGRRLIVLQATNEDTVGTFPVGESVHIPADLWRSVFKLGSKKALNKLDSENIRLDMEQVEIEEEAKDTEPGATAGRVGTFTKKVRTLVFSDVAGTASVRFELPEQKRYPDVSRVINQSPPMFRIRVDPLLLAELLKVVSTFSDGETVGVDLLYFGKDKPVGVMARFPGNGLVVDGLIVPLKVKDEPAKPKAAEPVDEAPEDNPADEVEPTEEEWDNREPNDEPPAKDIEPEPEPEVKPAKKGRRKKEKVTT